jgi:hypothetical protein
VIQKVFREPNFKCRVANVDGTNIREFVIHGEDEAGVRERLERKRRLRVLSIEPYDFSGWKMKARKNTEDATATIQAGGKYNFDANNLWSQLKDHLFDLFDEKCAYCEITMLGAYFGDVEHYRPKSGIADDKTHSGYYWLAYDPLNYLPACNRCNNSKSNHFPLAMGSPRAQGPGDDINSENPLYLNPYRLDPCKHIVFRCLNNGEKIGAVAVGLTEEGKKTIEDLDLNRGDLLCERSREQMCAVADFFISMRLGLRPNPVIEGLNNGDRPFCAASLDAIMAVCHVFGG